MMAAMDVAIYMPPNVPSIKGRAAIGATFSKEASGGITVKLKDIESGISDDLGFKIGFYKVYAPDNTKVDKGRYVEIYKEVDGKWLMHRDIYSITQPAVPADMASTMAAESYLNRPIDLEQTQSPDFTCSQVQAP